MNFEIAKTIVEVLGDNVQCKLNYTPDFVEYMENVDGQFDGLEPLEAGIFESLENLIKDNNITTSVEATAFISDEDSYVYVNDDMYMMAVLPVGNNEKYRACLVKSVY